MSFGGGGSSSGGTQVVQNEPYAPAQPALNQIISDAKANESNLSREML